MNTLIIKIIGGIIGVIVIIFLVYIITPFFISKRVDDAVPVTESVSDTTTVATSGSASSMKSPSVTEESGTTKVPNKETVPVAAETQAPVTAITQDQSVAPIAPTTPNAAAIIGTKGHPAEGQVRIVSSGGKQYVRYENFKTINGPDLLVYLSKDLEARQYVSLGKLKATEGNINYEIPRGVNVSGYKYALVWCDAFSVLFNSAELQK